jgi:hypothetical protein
VIVVAGQRGTEDARHLLHLHSELMERAVELLSRDERFADLVAELELQAAMFNAAGSVMVDRIDELDAEADAT